MLQVTVWQGPNKVWTGVAPYPLQLGRQVDPTEELFKLHEVGAAYRLAVASLSERTVSRRAVSVTILEDGSIQVCNLRVNSLLLAGEIKCSALQRVAHQATFRPTDEVVIWLTAELRLQVAALRVPAAELADNSLLPSFPGGDDTPPLGSLDNPCSPAFPLPSLHDYDQTLPNAEHPKTEQSEKNSGPLIADGLPQVHGEWGTAPADGFLSGVFGSLSTSIRAMGTKVKSFVRENQCPLDNVHFAVFAPGQVAAGSQFVLSIWAYLFIHHSEVLKRASRGGRFKEVGSQGPIRIERGTDLTIHLFVNGLIAAEPTVVLHWADNVANTQFRVAVPESSKIGFYPGEIRVFSRGVQLTCIYFDLEVLESSCSTLVNRQQGNLQSTQQRVKSVFASYSHEDSIAVMQWARGAGSVGVNVFLDTLSLHAGSDWQSRLATAIEKCDLFCLFWSEASSKSEWVEKEWRYALEKRGCRYIQPVPLVDPAKVRPPAELANCTHFEDVARIVIEYQKLMQ